MNFRPLKQLDAKYLLASNGIYGYSEGKILCAVEWLLLANEQDYKSGVMTADTVRLNTKEAFAPLIDPEEEEAEFDYGLFAKEMNKEKNDN